jgi:hypothetical protein
VRFFKLVLSQHPDGSWNASSTTAFALEARATTETANVKQSLFERIKETLSSAAEELDADHGDMTEAVLQGLRGEQVAEDEEGKPVSGAQQANPGDDPLTCSADASACGARATRPQAMGHPHAMGRTPRLPALTRCRAARASHRRHARAPGGREDGGPVGGCHSRLDHPLLRLQPAAPERVLDLG